MTLSRLEIHKPRCGELVFALPSAHQQSTLEHHDQGVLMNLMIVEPFALRQGEQDHAVGVVV